MAEYVVYDMEEIAKEAHRIDPHYDKEEYMAWSVPDLLKYMGYLRSRGHELFGEIYETENYRVD